MRTRNKVIILIIVVVVGIGIYLKTKPKVIEVTNEEVATIVVKKTVSASGSVTAVNDTDLALPVIGQLQSIYVEEGENVSPGQTLANLYNYDYTQDTQYYKEAKDVAKRDLDIYIENYLTNPNAVGGEDEYKLGVKRLKDLLDKADAAYQSSLGTLSKTFVSSPFAGTVVDIYYDIGEVVGAGSAIFKIANLDSLMFTISIDQEDFGFLKIDQPVKVTLDSYEEKTFEGVVNSLPAYADEDTEEFEIKITLNKLENYPALLGMNGDASIITASTEHPVPALSFDLVYFNGDTNPFIWVNDNGKLKKMTVEIGLEGDVYIEILTDLSNVTVVSPESTDTLEEGFKIKTNGK